MKTEKLQSIKGLLGRAAIVKLENDIQAECKILAVHPPSSLPTDSALAIRYSDFTIRLQSVNIDGTTVLVVPGEQLSIK